MIRRGIAPLRQIVRPPKNRAEQRGLILLYHRVAESHSDPWFLSVTPGHLAEHLKTLRQHAQPISLQRLSQGLLDGDLPERPVVLTFDDGYADNLHEAKPLLERYGIPATVFVATGYIGHERGFWWDELDRLLLQPGTLPRELRLRIDRKTYRWKLGKAAHYYYEDTTRRPLRWRSQGDGASVSRRHLYYSLWELLHPLAEGERQKVLDQLRAWADAESEASLTPRPLSSEEVVALAQGELIEIGAHTVTHPALAALPAALQRDEILKSRIRLEEILGRRVSSFSYPHSSLSAETIAMVRESDFARACTTVTGDVERSTDLFRLPREPVGDWDGREFAKRLSRWFDY